LAFLDMVGRRCLPHRTGSKARRGTSHRLLRAHEDKSYSFCDALSFVVMERLRVKEAVAFDRHFRGYGGFMIL